MNTAPRTSAQTVHLARAAADAAARAARTVVREVDDLSEMAAIVDLYGTVWGRRTRPPLTIELLRALRKTGNYVAGAFDGVRLVGASVGFFHAPGRAAMQSHISGVVPSAAGRSIGFALKQHQRAWALSEGVRDIYWTFDPLVSRNAQFNLTALGAEPVEYLTDFYGPLVDAINFADDSDRLLVRWRLADPAVAAAAVGNAFRHRRPADAAVALGISETGEPVPGHVTAQTLCVAVPTDFELLRVRDSELTQRWRSAVRTVMSRLFEQGGRVVGFDPVDGYVVNMADDMAGDLAERGGS